MKTRLQNLALALAVSTVTVVMAGGVPSFAAEVRTVATSEAAALPAATVRALQEALNGQGIAVTVDGVLGDETRAAIRQYQSQHHLPVTGDPDRATLDKLGVAGGGASSGEATGGSAMMGGGMMGGGMMGRGMKGSGGMPGMMGGQVGQGMPGPQAAMPMAGGMMTCPMMQMASSGHHGDGARPAMGSPRMGIGPGTFYGMASDAAEEMTPERVRVWLEQRLEEHANPRLKIGDIVADGAGITAEIVTVDGSLVQKLAFNRHPGFVRVVR